VITWQEKFIEKNACMPKLQLKITVLDDKHEHQLKLN